MKKQNILKILNISFVLIILLSFSCGEKRKGITTVTFWHAMGGPLGDALNKLIEEFNSKNPEIEIESISMGNYNALSQKIMAGILSGKIPTIAQVYSSWTSNLYESNVIDPVENYINGDNGLTREELSDIYDVLIKDNTIDNKLVTLPFNKSVYAYYYNMDFFENENIRTFPDSWTSLLSTSLKMQEDSQPVTAFGVSVGFFESVLYAFGGRMVDDNKKPAFYSEEGIEALEFIKDFIYKYRLAELTTGFQHQDQFIAKKIAYIMGTSVSYSFIMNSNPEFRVGLAALPREDTTGVMIMGTNIAIFKNRPEEEKRAAWKFIKWFTEPEQQAEWSMNTGYIPVRISATELPVIKDYFEKVPGLKGVWDQLYYAEIEPSDPSWLFGRNIFSQVGLEPVLRGQMDVEERLKLAEEEVSRVLER